MGTEADSKFPKGVLETPLLRKVLLVLGGVILLAISSYIAIPMIPVPITMQTLAVTSLGALYGWRLGAATVVIWLAIGAFGLPVFAGGGSGLSHFSGPTAGYLFAFPVAAAATGWLVGRGWNARKTVLAFSAMLIGNFICLSVGAVWLSTKIGFEPALASGFAPFLIGAIIKSGMGVVVLRLAQRS